MASYERHIIRGLSALAVAACAAFLLAAAPPAGKPVSGIPCEAMEGNVLHTHQHLAIFDHGKAVPIPPDVGRPFVTPCIYWTHTHTPDGIIHVEAPFVRDFTLGEFFAVWGEPLGRSDVAGYRPRRGERIAFWVDGQPYAGDPRRIPLVSHTDVVIEVGPPYIKRPPFADWHGL